MSSTLSKSDFKVARDCPTKLYYRKLKYPDSKAEDEYLQLLAEGGYAVGLLAQLLHPGGVDLGDIGDPGEAVRRTNELLRQDRALIYEAAVRHGACLVRVDVLVKEGDVLELIEVKSKSYDSAKPDMVLKRGGIDSKWRPYVEDVAYQTLVARRAFPEMRVVPFLMMPNKQRTTAIEGLNSQFRVERKPPRPGSRFRNFQVTFTGDVEALRRDKLLVKVPMAKLVDPMLDTLANATEEFAASLEPELTRIPPVLSVACAKCEYRNASQDPAKDGFRQCWGKLADVSPLVLDLYRAGNFSKGLNELIEAGKVALSDVPDELLVKADGEPKYQGRPLMQRDRRTEWIGDELKAEVKGWTYPLHFIDFETSRMALPYHAGMRPYAQIAFQWSCHTIRTPGAEPEHHDWINTVDAFPSFDFARSLMEHLGRQGTVLMWSHHERTTLRDIRNQMDDHGEHDAALADWLDWIAPQKDTGLEGPLVDMDKLARRGYFHPAAGGRTSIKVTLPAVLQAQASERIPRWLREFDDGVDLLGDGTGLENPYKLLPGIDRLERYGTLDEEENVGNTYHVNEGTAAMRAYQDMLYGLARDDDELKAKLREALRIYCKLDTLAMVIIWEHWRR